MWLFLLNYYVRMNLFVLMVLGWVPLFTSCFFLPPSTFFTYLAVLLFVTENISNCVKLTQLDLKRWGTNGGGGLNTIVGMNVSIVSYCYFVKLLYLTRVESKSRILSINISKLCAGLFKVNLLTEGVLLGYKSSLI